MLGSDISLWQTDDEILKILGSRLKERRLLRNITQEELAHEVGVTKLTIQKIEQGHGSRLEIFISILRYFNELDKLNLILQAQNISIKEQYATSSKKQRQRARK